MAELLDQNLSPSEERSRKRKDFKVIAPISSLDEARMILPLADILVREKDGRLIILLVLTVPEGQARADSATEASSLREGIYSLVRELITGTAQIKTTVFKAEEVLNGIYEFTKAEKAGMLLIGWQSRLIPEITLKDTISHFLSVDPPCPVVALRPSQTLINGEGWVGIKKVLMGIRGGVHSTLTLRVAYAIAQQNEGRLTLLHVCKPDAPEEEIIFEDSFQPAVENLDLITETLIRRGDVGSVILKESHRCQALVMGMGLGGVQENTGLNLLDRILTGTDCTVIMVKEAIAKEQATGEAMQPGEVVVDRPVALVVDKWFAENTFHSQEFADLERLLVLKNERKLTISLGLPALNEEETVGEVISSVKQALVDEIPLLDEIVLIDSGSEDSTRDIAADLGIPVYIHQDILPNYGSYHGKGEALWKSLYVLKGDLIAWIDTDIKNIHPRFVYGVIGPLLRVPHIHYVKGFYRRPLADGDKLMLEGGGRVTELTARPFFNLFFPELSGLIQPLSGEYAGRRTALERMPFFTGYGVETGLLIDLLDSYGLNSIAQVDLLERIHHNQPLPSLSKMSFAIMQVLMSRLEKKHNTRLLVESNRSMNLIRHGKRRRYYLESIEI
ncbi:MAG: glucosyl-3-phosphoglycerate synthase, partial [Chloroflexi bacterium]